MSESTEPTSSQPQPEDMHWAVSYLREDLQDIRNETRGLHERIDDARAVATNESRDLRKRIDEVSAEASKERRDLCERIEAVSAVATGERRDLHKRIDDTTSSLNTSMNARFDTLSARLDSNFRWTMMAMISIAGLLAAMIKL